MILEFKCEKKKNNNNKNNYYDVVDVVSFFLIFVLKVKRVGCYCIFNLKSNRPRVIANFKTSIRIQRKFYVLNLDQK